MIAGAAMSRDTRYAYAVGRVRALERRMLTRTDFARLLDAPDLDAVLSLLADTPYGARLSLAPWPEALREEERATLDQVDELAPDPALGRGFRSRHDFHNLKVFLKAQRSGRLAEAALSEFGRVSRAVLERAFGEEPEPLPEPLETARRRADEAYERTSSPVALDAAVDQVLAESLLALFGSRSLPFLSAWVALRSDAANLQAFVRLKWAGEDPRLLREVALPGGTIPPERLREIEDEALEAIPQRLAATPYGRVLEDGIAVVRSEGRFDRLASRFDGLEVEHLARARWEPFGAEPLFGYARMKEVEIRALRALLVGKANGIEADRLRENLPGAYA